MSDSDNAAAATLFTDAQRQAMDEWKTVTLQAALAEAKRSIVEQATLSATVQQSLPHPQQPPHTLPSPFPPTLTPHRQGHSQVEAWANPTYMEAYFGSASAVEEKKKGFFRNIEVSFKKELERLFTIMEVSYDSAVTIEELRLLTWKSIIGVYVYGLSGQANIFEELGLQDEKYPLAGILPVINGLNKRNLAAQLAFPERPRGNPNSNKRKHDGDQPNDRQPPPRRNFQLQQPHPQQQYQQQPLLPMPAYNQSPPLTNSNLTPLGNNNPPMNPNYKGKASNYNPFYRPKQK